MAGEQRNNKLLLLVAGILFRFGNNFLPSNNLLLLGSRRLSIGCKGLRLGKRRFLPSNNLLLFGNRRLSVGYKGLRLGKRRFLPSNNLLLFGRRRLLPSCNLPLPGSKEAARGQITVRRAPDGPHRC
uniref:hypothetical protein n=1 Tax=Candidatus Electronema sp. TaxID=2698783 RepID=UPI0040574523